MHIPRVKPHELIAALVERTGRSLLQIAEDMAPGRNFQPTLFRFTTGQVANPSRATAKRIADYFDLPVDALYDARLASQLAQARGLAPATSSAPQVQEADARYVVAASGDAAWPDRSVGRRIARLSDNQRAHLTALVIAFLDAVQPDSTDSKQQSAA